jgi:predicted transcriptional regulator
MRAESRIVVAQKCALLFCASGALLRIMSFADQVRQVESRAAEQGIDMKEVLAQAGIHRATLDRWKAGTSEPQMRKWRRITDTLEKLARAKERAA